jgi:hypothetical protein
LFYEVIFKANHYFPATLTCELCGNFWRTQSGAPTLGNTSFKEVLTVACWLGSDTFRVSDEDTWRPVQYAAPEVADGVVYLGNTKTIPRLDAESGNTFGYRILMGL